MRTAGWILVAVGVLFAFLVLIQIVGNRNLAIPGPDLLPGALDGYFRLLIGPCAWVSGTAFGAAFLAFRGVRPFGWLALVIPLIVVVPVFLSATFLPSALSLVIVSIVDVVGLALLVALVGGWISRARERALARGRGPVSNAF